MSQPPDNDTAADPTSLNVTFDLLRNSYRRRILMAVADDNPPEDGEFTLEEFPEGDEHLDELRTILYHCHLPKLADAGYIEWDQDTETVRAGRHFDDIAPLITLLAEHREKLPGNWP